MGRDSCQTSAVTTIAVLQARTSSSRLPGKVLAPLADQPMILCQLERIKRARTIDSIIIATSVDQTDDALAETVRAAGYDVVRGPLEDVLGRFVKVLDEYPATTVVRLTADCPLISPAVIDLVVNEFHASGADYLSNTMTPTFPDGLDVEVVKASVLREVAQASTDPHEREHVTLGVYRRHETYVVRNFVDPAGRDNSHLRWTVDNPDDFAFVAAIYAALWQSNPTFDYEDVLDYLDENPHLHRTDDDSPRNAALQGLDTGAMLVAGLVKWVMDTEARLGREIAHKRESFEDELRQHLQAMRTSFFGQLDQTQRSFEDTATAVMTPLLLEAYAQAGLQQVQNRLTLDAVRTARALLAKRG